MGTRAGLRVVLDPEHRLVAVGHGRNGSVVEIEVGDLDLLRIQCGGIQGKAVVLTGDLNLSRRSTGMVESSMAVIEFVGGTTEGQSKNLICLLYTSPSPRD